MATRFMSISPSSSSASPIPRNSSFSTPPSSLHPLFSSASAAEALHFKVGARWSVRCMTSLDTKSEAQLPDASSAPPPSTSSETTPSSSSSSPSTSNVSSFYWSVALGGIGFAETAYLSYLKLTNSTAFCPIGATGGCTDILSSDYSVVFWIWKN